MLILFVRWQKSGVFLAAPHGRDREVCALDTAPNERVACTPSQEDDAGFIEDNIDLMVTADDLLLTEANADTPAHRREAVL